MLSYLYLWGAASSLYGRISQHHLLIIWHRHEHCGAVHLNAVPFGVRDAVRVVAVGEALHVREQRSVFGHAALRLYERAEIRGVAQFQPACRRDTRQLWQRHEEFGAVDERVTEREAVACAECSGGGGALGQRSETVPQRHRVCAGAGWRLRVVKVEAADVIADARGRGVAAACRSQAAQDLSAAGAAATSSGGGRVQRRDGWW